MPTVKSLEDLKRIREEALQKREIKSAPGSIQIVVGMGTPGIARSTRRGLRFLPGRTAAGVQRRQLFQGR